MRTVTIGVALVTLRESHGLTQDELSAASGVAQSRISKAERDKSLLDIEKIAAIEDALGEQRGTVLRMAGYVADSNVVTAAIDVDPSLTPAARQMLKAAYTAARQGPTS